ncbi:unnamed protein product [Bursaphelenchus xylophilus]|uniref:(pine wood nematode) hypothetical protein n=1 Tax=Bursaphelenchus xylophilus TaxID=6326 RepID=A0A1I7RKQ6_BURXY|nr:unnamed protein product [Bursaphelenchus xylophilus]CAG9131152.1 unnamed protein product [Bursaphelenchus xylophilus]
MISKFINSKGEPNLFQQKVHIQTKSGKTAEINVVFQDTKPEGSPIGTLIAVHGAPGSHKDFKYLWPVLDEKGVRVIGVNWPGMGYTSYDEALNDDNDERVQLVQHLVEELGLKSNTVFMGHSRGSENALKMAALYKDHCSGCVLVNPITLRAHRGVQPYPLVCFLGWIWKTFTPLRFITNPFLHWFYHSILGLRSVDGHAAGVSLHLMNNVDFGGQIKYIEQVNQSNVKVLNCSSGKDFLIQRSLNEEFGSKFKDAENLVCTSKDDDSEVDSQMKAAFASGKTKVNVFFTPDGHFLQKTRAKFLADGVVLMLESNNNHK